MKKTYLSVAVASLLITSMPALSAISSTVNVASDYTFNGVSQTQEKPALQASLDYAADSGFYAGTWVSNVDFGGTDDTNIEWDFYAGQYFQLNEKLGLDAGIAFYTYHGDSASSSYKYPEAYAKLNYVSTLGTSELNFWYSWDYFGLEVGHSIAMIAHTVEVAPNHNIKFTFDRSMSNDSNIWTWDGKKNYNHYRVAYMTTWNELNVDLAVEDTNMNLDIADTRVVLSVSKTFDF